MASAYSRDDAADDTDVQGREVDIAWHEAREDCQEDGYYGSDEWGRDSDDGEDDSDLYDYYYEDDDDE